MSEDIQKFTKLKSQIDSISADKIRIEERHKNERENLERLLKEITSRGYDPTKLSELKVATEADLKKVLDELQAKVNDILDKLSQIEKGQ